MREFDLIDRLTRDLPTHPDLMIGPGDDCAVLTTGDGSRALLFKADAVVEGVHFTSDIAPERIGHKALARALSDIAAMGGTPSAALVTLALPATYDPDRIIRIYDGMSALARRYRVAIAGGETTLNPGGILISIALLGYADASRLPLRSKARSGQAIFVSGELGGSLEAKHLDFEPRITHGQWLARQPSVGAMIDLSDGLGGDLKHILQASHVGAELLASAIPISQAARQRSQLPGGRTPLLAALADGEDFELLFTADRQQAVSLLDAWKTTFPDLRLSCIGKITSEPGLRLRDERGVHLLPNHGYVHFA